MIYFDEDGKELLHICRNCDKKHSGCDTTDEDLWKLLEGKACKDFVVGKCFGCKQYLENGFDSEVCDVVFIPTGCKNYQK